MLFSKKKGQESSVDQFIDSCLQHEKNIMEMEVDFHCDSKKNEEVKDETLLSEVIDTEENTLVEETFEERYLKIQKEMKMKPKEEEPPLKRKLYKVKLNDFLYSDHYSQLKKAALDGRILKLEDIDKMLKGEKVNQERCMKDSKRFLKNRKDDQLLRDLCSTDLFLKENITSDKNGPNIKKETNKEHLLEEW